MNANLARGVSHGIKPLGPRMAPDEPLPYAVRRMTVELLNGAIVELGPRRKQSFDMGVHSARKNLKRVRGLIRFVRDTVGYRTYRDQNVVLRDVSRTFAGTRDSWVLVKTLRGLRGDYVDVLGDEAFSQTEAWLLKRHEERQGIVRDQAVINAITNLGTARSRFAGFPVEDAIANDFGSIAKGMQRVYRRGHRGYQRAMATGTVEDLHEWRKRVKYLRYQMEALEPLQPALIGSMAKELDELGEDLGDDHDLAVLAETVMQYPEACYDAREEWLMMAVIYRERRDLQARAFRRGAALFAERPEGFVERIDAYWESGRR